MLEILGILLIIIGIIYLLIIHYIGKFNQNFPTKKRDKMNNFCILIPARDESQVIESLLISISKQTKKVNMQDVYIIIENEADKTLQIAQKYKAKVFIRKKLDLKRKGYALNEVIEDLCQKQIYYDAYFIIDADNILDANFILKMEDTFRAGYDIGMGYRNLKNGNDNIIAAAAGITFSFINTSGNEAKNNDSRNITLSGSGLFIHGDLIKKWQSFPFHSLTEDYESSLYYTLNNLTTYYNKDAIFYDEQPLNYRSSEKQRIRWIRGYFDNRIKYSPLLKKKLKHNKNKGSVLTELTGMRPYILMILGALLYILNQTINLFKRATFKTALFKILLIIFLIYILLMAITLFIIRNENQNNIF